MPANLLRACLGATRGVVRVSGADARAFLQGFVTADVRLLDRQPAVYGAFLNHQGRLFADAFIFRHHEQDCLVECDRELAAALAKHLNFFKMRTKVTITDATEAFTPWAVWRAREADPDPDPAVVARIAGSNLAHALDRRGPAEDLRVLLPTAAGEAPGVLGDLTAEAMAEDYHLRRMGLGVAEGAKELPHLRCFPLECNLDYAGGVALECGCYLGQELTTRTFHRGATRKRAFPVQFFPSAEAGLLADRPEPARGRGTGGGAAEGRSLIDQEERKVGTVLSALHNVGIAQVRLEAFLRLPADTGAAGGEACPTCPPLRVEGTTDLWARPFWPDWWPTTDGSHKLRGEQAEART